MLTDDRRSRRVAFQGIEGAYSHLASKEFFSDEPDRTIFTGCMTFADVIKAVEDGKASYGVLPIENTTAGSINQVYDLLTRAHVYIVGEEIYSIDHCLLGLKSIPLSHLTRIYSHPQALAQCEHFLAGLHHCEQVPFNDTAMAVQKIKTDGDPFHAAIASDEAGRLYGITILARNIADERVNLTRFLVVATEPVQVDGGGASKTSLVIGIRHQEGALLEALSVLHGAHINLTKLESRPKPGSPFEYLFYIDFEGSITEDRVKAALGELRRATSFLKILGSYPSQRASTTRPG